ncbi:hypothetical protein AX15_002378 [Amanita polypyramis BW_CC]|nr:hypothetical protein AX15_002378 [Amanita polypyramis BW_CC]
MTPAPPEVRTSAGPVMPDWGASGGEGDNEPLAAARQKRPREGEGETRPTRFIDFRLHQTRKHLHTTGQFGHSLAYRRQAPDADDSRPQKKMATQVAFKSTPERAFSKHIMTATGIELQETPVQRKGSTSLRSVITHSPGNPSRLQMVRSAARKIPPTLHVSSLEEEALSTSELGSSDPEQEAVEQAPKRKRLAALAHKSTSPWYRSPSSTSSDEDGDNEQDEDEENENDQDKVNEVQFVSPMLVSPVRSTNERTTPPPAVEVEPQIQLFRAFNRHTDPPFSLQDEKRLPFLLRNLRKSFQVLCRNLNIPSIPEDDDKGSVLVRYEHVANAWFERTLPKWFCPLCDLLGRFETREMLKVHLGLDHKEAFFDWLQPTTENEQQGVSWRLLVLMPETDRGMPDLDNLSLEHRVTASTPETIPPPTSAPIEPPSSPPITTRTSVTVSDKPRPEPTTTTNTLSPRLPPRANDDPYFLFPPDEPITPAPSSSPPIHVPKKPRPPQYPRPPPSSYRLGPAARKPYLPAKSPYGGPDIDYSTRIGGPYLFDLLQLLPLEPYGLLDWMVLEREAEIFNDDELTDELKVIVALWARWMMLNKNVFAKNCVEGVRQFIDEYWRMIHLAAGWEALVYQILVFVAYRLIGQSEVIPLILYYEKLVGMDYWVEWDSTEE